MGLTSYVAVFPKLKMKRTDRLEGKCANDATEKELALTA